MFNNTIYLKGILSPYFFSHESNNKRYLQSSLLCIRDNQPYNIPIKFREDMLKTNNIDIGKEITTVGTIRTYNKKLYVHTNLCNVNWENEHNNLDCEIYGKVVKANEKFKFYIVECDSTVFIPVRQAEDV